MTYLSEKAEKGTEGKILTQKQIHRLTQLDSWIKKTGKMEGFLEQESGDEGGMTEPPGELAASAVSPLMSAEFQEQGSEAVSDDQFEELIRAAAELKGQHLVIPQLVVQQLAAQMTYDDLPDDIRARVDEVRGLRSPQSSSPIS